MINTNHQVLSLDPNASLYHTQLPAELNPTPEKFEELWNMHPADFHTVTVHGKRVILPRWQQAYEKDYTFSQNTSPALPLPPAFAPYLQWVRDHIHPPTNGLLMNWYAPEHKHYIGKHRDSTQGLVPQSPIITISLGGSRTLRMRPWRGKGFQDFPLVHGDVYTIPYDTNLTWTHEIPHRAKDQGRRISITCRTFA
ncbi:MAG: alpha-ketoglutarate-dependent dioxygenase AlkB [Myxococcota bacterium]